MRYLIGIGNYYGLDDSVGLRLAEVIGERGLDRGFQAIDMGGNLLDLLHYLSSEAEQVLIVDSACMGMTPGSYTLFTPDEVATRKPRSGLSTHEGDLLKVLEFAAALGHVLPPVTILGIEPARIGDAPGLSAELESRFEEYVAAAVAFFGTGSEQPG